MINSLISVLASALLIVAASIVFAIPIMLLWNWVIPAIFGLPQITVLQALALNVLSGLLIRS